MSLTLEVGDENITITDKGDNVMTFPLVSDTPTEDVPETAKVLIQKIQDAIGNEVTVTALADSYGAYQHQPRQWLLPTK